MKKIYCAVIEPLILYCCSVCLLPWTVNETNRNSGVRSVLSQQRPPGNFSRQAPRPFFFYRAYYRLTTASEKSLQPDFSQDRTAQRRLAHVQKGKLVEYLKKRLAQPTSASSGLKALLLKQPTVEPGSMKRLCTLSKERHHPTVRKRSLITENLYRRFFDGSKLFAYGNGVSIRLEIAIMEFISLSIVSKLPSVIVIHLY